MTTAGDDARPGWTITTIAGTGEPGCSGDGEAATSRLNRPCDVVVAPSGDIYLSDCANHRVRRIDAATRTITTVAGTDHPGRGPDGAPADESPLNNPLGLALDTAGNLYIADALNHRVVRVDAGSRTLTTVAGTGDPGYDAEPDPRRSRLNEPNGVAIDADGRLYIADTGNYLLRKVEDDKIGTVAGTRVRGYDGDDKDARTAKLDTPNALALDTAGNVYLADGDRVRVVDRASGFVHAVAGTDQAGFDDDVPAVKARLDRPRGLAVDHVGNVFIADADNHRLRVVDLATGLISTVAGDGTVDWHGDGTPADRFSVARPHGVAIAPDGALVVGDTDHHRVRAVTGASGGFTVRPGLGPVALAKGCGVRYPGVLVTAEGDAAIARQRVTAVLPGDGIEFVAEGSEGTYQLTIEDQSGGTRYATGTLDASTLVFTDVDLGLSGSGSTVCLWVAVRASADARTGPTALSFAIGGRGSASTPLVVVDQGAFRVEPAAPAPAERGGPAGYPGVVLYPADAGTACRAVAVRLPQEHGLRFAESALAYPLYVQADSGDKRIRQYTGQLSEDHRTVAYGSVDLALSGPGTSTRAWVAVAADADATAGRCELEFTVGGQRAPSGVDVR